MRTFGTLALLPLAAAGCIKNSTSSISSYDYIIVGGGTSGLVVAKRLSEDPAVSVLVIEAGDSVESNVNVTDPLGYGYAFGTEIDWAFQTVEQKYADNAPQTLRAGKALGGTSTINGLAYTRAEDIQIDLWEKLGNRGWNWENLLPYYLKSERFQTLSPSRESAGHLTFEPEVHGEDGPLHTGWIYGMTNTSFPVLMNETFRGLGLEWNADVNDGKMVGYSAYPSTVNQELNVREDAARAYYFPFRDQKNLRIMLNTAAKRIDWKKVNQSQATANGVWVANSNGETDLIKANKEVILSAGALVSPLILEASGVGNPAILEQHQIQTVVDLPTVGENLQDQMNNALQFAIANNFSATEKNAIVAYPSASQVFGDDFSAVAEQVKASLPGYAAQVASANGNVTRAEDLLSFFQMQYDLIFGPSKVPIAEVLIYQKEGVWDNEYWGLLPFARGSVHIGSGSASSTTAADALINPNYFMLDWDVTQQAGAARFIRRMYGTAPFSAEAGTETAPGLEAVGADADDEEWGAWLKKNYRSNFHPVSTAAMMPREVGGVVDGDLRVYGTANVRVVDASVLPFQVCGHLTSTLYAVAERASDLIKGGGS
ncbi:GMC oxidoreductase [Xylariomycetidae sp. FL2044]|nr:GMC oxidoreductase [Xylariomycetidae sp. FL2044]